MQWDSLWFDANIATLTHAGQIQKAAMGIKNGLIAWLGPQDALQKPLKKYAKTIISAQNHWITPGLIDCHTHLVYGGNRVNEFTQRLNGMSYAQIAKAGGGIQTTVKSTRHASEEQLFQQSLPRLKNLLAEGVTTVEIKSGYGLDIETELKMLRVAKRFATELPVTIKTSFLGAHAIPPEFDNTEDYIHFVCDTLLPQIAETDLIDAVDGFCETIGFTHQQMERVFKTAKNLNLPVKLHAEQLSNQQGAQLAAKYQALSADHLEYIDEAGVQAMAKAGTVAVLLPGAFYFLQETKRPPIDLFRQYKVPIAIATDCNPGSSPCTSLLLILNMACTLFRLTPMEALLGVTKHAAMALGMGDSHGSLAVGKVADFVVWNIHSPDEICYRFGFNPCAQIIKGGISHGQFI